MWSLNKISLIIIVFNYNLLAHKAIKNGDFGPHVLKAGEHLT